MFKNNLINTVNEYYFENKQLSFYRHCLDYLENFKTSDNGFIPKIIKNPYLLESVRIHLCYNQNKYHVYLYNKKKKNCTNYVLKMSPEMKDKFMTQVVCLSDGGNILDLAGKINIPSINFLEKKNNSYICVLISDKKLKNKQGLYEVKNLYETSGYLFGLEIRSVLYYQRLDRLINFIKTDKEALVVIKMINEYLKFIRSFDWKLRERMLIFSGCLFTALGLTYTRDIDILVLNENNTPEESKELIVKLTKNPSIDIEPTVLASDGAWYEKNNQSLEYKKTWLTYILPNFGGAEDIFEVISNPKHNFLFMGIKFCSIDINIKRFISRSNPNSMTDLIMLQKINNYPVGDKLCIPNLTIRQGKLKIFDNSFIEYLYKDIKKKLKLFYNTDMDINEISKILQKCNTTSFDIYKGKPTYDKDTSIIKKFHILVKNQIFKQYASNVSHLLDVGIGRGTDLKSWSYIGIRHVVGIEPSIESIKHATKNIEYIKNMKVDLINGVGNVDWTTKPEYELVFKYKYDVISFQFMIHYVISNIDIVIKNIKKVMNNKCKIIVTCMDGNLIHADLNKNKIIEIRNKEEPIFAIAPEYDVSKPIDFDSKILVYFKGAYGVSSGSIEPLVDLEYLIKVFSNNNIKLITKKPFLEYNVFVKTLENDGITKYNVNLKDELKEEQKNVSKYYTSLIFEYLP